ncbi:Vacuolar protein sorting-associated protein 8 [Bachmanniomyces sp. S44760]|nr:Vacuolar protein sorting-associated protein 8 [Bachmanniomyces sp. S44760]
MSSAQSEADVGHDTESETGTDEDVEGTRAESPGNPVQDDIITEDIGQDERETGEVEGLNGGSPIATDVTVHGVVGTSAITAIGRTASVQESLSTPDDGPSAQNSLASFSASPLHLANHAHSPTPFIRPFDRRLQARLSPSPLTSPRPQSPAFPDVTSRQSSLSGQLFRDSEDVDTPDIPWEVIRWTKLRKMSGQMFSEIGKRNFGRPTCLAVSASIAVGTSKGVILVFDYHQNLQTMIGAGTKAVESGAVTSLAISADHTMVAGGHASGSIFTWDVSRAAKPSVHISPTELGRHRGSGPDGHVLGAAVVHIGFLGSRQNALVSADDKGMAFSHSISMGLAVVTRTARSTRILGRYPELSQAAMRMRKPSSVLAFSPLPLGNIVCSTDSMGVVAMLTPYLLVIVSTSPIAQTQYKAARPKDLDAHSALSATLAWFPAVKLKSGIAKTSEVASQAKLAYCWSNVLIILEISEEQSAEGSAKDKPTELHFLQHKRWKAEEPIVAMQWLGRSILAVLTITQQLLIVEDVSLRVTDSSDLVKKHIYHNDLFSQQLNLLIEELDEEDVSMHGVTADAFYMSFKAYKGRLFLLGFNDITVGTLSNWADRLLALMEHGNFVGAVQLATSYYNGNSEKVTIGLPDNEESRHTLVQEKLLEMMLASLRYAFGKNREADRRRSSDQELEALAAACFAACISMYDMEFLFEDVYPWYAEGEAQSLFLEILESHITRAEVTSVPPSVLKDLTQYFVEKGQDHRLEEIFCRLDPQAMDIDQITSLCRSHRLYEALLYVWCQALGDYTTILAEFLEEHQGSGTEEANEEMTSKIFPFLSYTLTSRIYPTGVGMPEEEALRAKAQIYQYFFSGTNQSRHESAMNGNIAAASFPHLRKILELDAPSFMSTLNEAFEDSFLNGTAEQTENQTSSSLTDEQRYGVTVTRQFIISVLLEMMTESRFSPEDIVYLDMFIARNLPKFPQFILLPGSVLHRVLVELCKFSNAEISDDCQLSVEYLLSVYHDADLHSLIPLFQRAQFYRVLKSIYKNERQYALLLQTCFQDRQNPDALYGCVRECLRKNCGLSKKQAGDVRAVIVDHAHYFAIADLRMASSTLDAYAPDLHDAVLATLENDDHAQYQYLQELLDSESANDANSRRWTSKQKFVERYVRLLCDYDPHHVSEFIEHLQTGDLRLEEVMPALESSGNIDAAVVLLGRAGKVQDAMNRLSQHLQTLEAALRGLIDKAIDSPDTANTQEATEDILESILKYARIGCWLCKKHSNTASARQPQEQSKRTSAFTAELSSNESLWLDLIDVVVRITKDITDALSLHGKEKLTEGSFDSEGVDSSKITMTLRLVVQDTFSALLATTSTHREDNGGSANVSFPRIFRAFLNRAAESSPSLTSLRAVLAAVFSAYTYEESLLDLAHRLLDKDLFVNVADAIALRKKGWRPLGQVCEGCGKRAWGPGAGGEIWKAWTSQQKAKTQRHDSEIVDTVSPSGKNSKGKGVAESSAETTIRSMGPGSDMALQEDELKAPLGPLVVFSCRHLFHCKCLQAMKDTNSREIGDSKTAEFECPLCK